MGIRPGGDGHGRPRRASPGGVRPAGREPGREGLSGQRFEEAGYRIARIREEITARMPTPDETAGLRVPPGVPVIELLHTSFDPDRQPFEVTRFVLRADLNGLDYELPIKD